MVASFLVLIPLKNSTKVRILKYQPSYLFLWYTFFCIFLCFCLEVFIRVSDSIFCLCFLFFFPVFLSVTLFSVSFPFLFLTSLPLFFLSLPINTMLWTKLRFRSDDPSAENVGHKWTLSALLRHLKADGKDTALLMSQIEDVVVKTMLACANTIVTACKMFVPHNNNCFGKYGWSKSFYRTYINVFFCY